MDKVKLLNLILDTIRPDLTTSFKKFSKFTLSVWQIYLYYLVKFKLLYKTQYFYFSNSLLFLCHVFVAPDQSWFPRLSLYLSISLVLDVNREMYCQMLNIYLRLRIGIESWKFKSSESNSLAFKILNCASSCQKY